MDQEISEKLRMAILQFLERRHGHWPVQEEKLLSRYQGNHRLVCDVRPMPMQIKGMKFFCTGNVPASAATEEQLIQLLRRGELVHECRILWPTTQFGFHLKHGSLEIMLMVR